MLTFYVPPGIGDFSAMYSKLCHVDREMVIRSANDQPHRLGPFLDILKKVKNGGNSTHSAGASLAQTLPPGTDLISLDDGDYFLSINEWLEQGGKVANWIPGKTEYHFMTPKFVDNSIGHLAATTLIESFPKGTPLIGVYCSAYGNSRHWGFWVFDKWKIFLEGVSKLLPRNTIYLFLGASYDLAISEILHQWMMEEGFNAHLLLGKYHIGATIEIIRQLDYFFVFPSGLGFLADVVNTPHMMWFPRSIELMRGTFCDPVNFETWQTIHTMFAEPEVSCKVFEDHGLKFLEASCHLRSQK